MAERCFSFPYVRLVLYSVCSDSNRVCSPRLDSVQVTEDFLSLLCVLDVLQKDD